MDLTQQIENLTKKFEALDAELHEVKHNSANVAQQMKGITASLNELAESFKTFSEKYEGKPDIGYAGKISAMEKDLQILKEAYELGKVWKIKISGFFMAMTFLAGFVGVVFAVSKALIWLWDHLVIIKK